MKCCADSASVFITHWDAPAGVLAGGSEGFAAGYPFSPLFVQILDTDLWYIDQNYKYSSIIFRKMQFNGMRTVKDKIVAL